LYDMQQRRLLYISPAFETVWGRSAQWLYEDPARWLESVYEDDRARAKRLPTLDQPGKAFDEIYRVVWPDGSLRWIHDRRYAVFNAAGDYVRLVGVAEDITEAHEAADKMNEQIAHLAHIARVSTVGELVASIAHEVNQPLYAITNFSSAIAAALESRGKLPLAQLQHWNDEIAKAAGRAGEIIRRVRSYVTHGPTVRRPVDICAVIEESAALLL